MRDYLTRLEAIELLEEIGLTEEESRQMLDEPSQYVRDALMLQVQKRLKMEAHNGKA